MCSIFFVYIFFFKQKTAYEMRTSDWSSDVCSSDLFAGRGIEGRAERQDGAGEGQRPIARRACADDEADRLSFARRSVGGHHHELGRASCRERVCQYV